MVVGRDALGTALEPFFRLYADRVTWELTLVAVRGDEAEVRVHETAVLRPREGGSPSIRAAGWHTGIVRREADGVWRIAYDKSVIDEPPKALPEHAFELPADGA